METGVSYARRSSMEQRDNTSLPDQLRRMQAHAVANDIGLYASMWDDAESGSSLDRPALWEAFCMLKCIKCQPTPMPEDYTNETWGQPCACGKMQGLDTIIVWDFKRFGRDSAETVYLCLKVLDKLDKRLLIVDGSLRVDTKTPIGKFMLRLMAAMAELDRDELMDKFNRGKEYVKTSTPKYAEGGIPYGFKSDGLKKGGSNLVPEPEEYAALEYIHKLHAAGVDYAQIATLLNEQGFKARRGGQWHRTQVARACSPKTGASYPQYQFHMIEIRNKARQAVEELRKRQSSA